MGIVPLAVAVTDLKFYLPVHITSFDGMSSPATGTHLKINGLLRANSYNTIILQVDSFNNITTVDTTIKTNSELKAGFRALKIVEADDCLKNYDSNHKLSFVENRKSTETPKSKIPLKVSIFFYLYYI